MPCKMRMISPIASRIVPRSAAARHGVGRLAFLVWALLALFGSAVKTTADVIDKQKALDAYSWWDNRDWDWYKANIPFFECPDQEIVTTWYYRWQLVTKHLTYGSPNSGYSFTEFMDRPFWSGAYGAISCPAGHQLYEVRWLRDPQYARDYARYWFRTPGAEPRKYGSWIADAIWAANEVHPDAAFLIDLLPDLKKNFEGWEARQYVPEKGLFWQNGHDDGMEFNINSRQTKDILHGANGYRPDFNAYMYADALAIAGVARLAGDNAAARIYTAKAAELKQRVQTLLWDPKREFFFPMAMRDESDADGNTVLKNTLTYRSGKFAGNEHGREEYGYVPWQFNLPDPGYESAWKFLMDPNYFFDTYGPTTVERHDPLFLLQPGCCWWSGQSWPYATSQTLKALANLLQNYHQAPVTPEDYRKLLHIFAISHRKEGTPYLAEALNPDTGSFAGHDSYNHSEHYFHSSFNDLVITGLVGLKTRADDILEIDPLADSDWSWFALDDVSYRGHRLSIFWDRDGSRYHRGVGFQVLADGRKIASRSTLGKIKARLPALKAPPQAVSSTLRNYAVNNDGDYYPQITASFTDPRTPLSAVNDGNVWYAKSPPNRWSTVGSPNAVDWIALDLGTPRRVQQVKLYFLDDGAEIVAPLRFEVETWDGSAWIPISGATRTPEAPTGRRVNTLSFAPRDIRKVRIVFTHAPGGKTGISEVEVWGEGPSVYTAPPPPLGNLALNRRGEGFPKADASFHDIYGGLPKWANDGRVNYRPAPVNRWTSYGSKSASDWLEIDFGTLKEVGRVELYLYDDRGGVQPPASYTIQYLVEGQWKDAEDQVKRPAVPTGNAVNTATFAHITTRKMRVLFTHRGESRSGVTEMEVWKE